MAQQFKFVSHEVVTTKDGKSGYRETPYVRLRQGDNTPVIIQGGTYYSDGGKPIDEDKVPEWVKDHIRMMTADARDAVGLPRRTSAKVDPSLSK